MTATEDNTHCAGNQCTVPTKAEVTSAMQRALTAALATEEPWGNIWATAVLGALVWRAREAEEGSDTLMEILKDAQSHARVALHGTRGYRHVYVLEGLYSQWFLALPPDPSYVAKPAWWFRAECAAMQGRARV